MVSTSAAMKSVVNPSDMMKGHGLRRGRCASASGRPSSTPTISEPRQRDGAWSSWRAALTTSMSSPSTGMSVAWSHIG